MSDTPVLSEIRDGVGLLTLHRPEVLNALNGALMAALGAALERFEQDPAIGAMVLTGSDQAFAAGADIGEMADRGFAEMYAGDHFTGSWERTAASRKPIVAAVAGYALGGGCELAMMCDFIIAADSARFGQPEIKLGVLPGLGGTQRLTRLVGRSKAMDMCLTGRMMEAAEAERAGLVSRVVPAAELVDEALAAARAMAGMSRPALSMIREAINRSQEGSLSEGIRFERRLFHAAFALEDQKEGMHAFLDKRTPHWQHR